MARKSLIAPLLGTAVVLAAIGFLGRLTGIVKGDDVVIRSSSSVAMPPTPREAPLPKEQQKRAEQAKEDSEARALSDAKKMLEEGAAKASADFQREERNNKREVEKLARSRAEETDKVRTRETHDALPIIGYAVAGGQVLHKKQTCPGDSYPVRDGDRDANRTHCKNCWR